MALSKIKSSSMADTAIHGRRNLIINGAMQVAQRVGDSSSTGNNYAATPDRIRQEAYGGASASFQRVTDAPTGFKHSLKVTCAGTSIASSGNTLRLMTGLEGQDVAHLSYGTSEAKTTTLSFYVKGSETGTYSVAFNNIRPSGGLQNVTRAYIKTYTIDVANTWEYKTLTFPGSTDGTWGSSNSDGITIVFDLGSGSDHQGATNQWLTTPDNMASGQVTLGDSNGGTWQITGIQLEVGSQATPFEHRSFGEELALCQRYYEKSYEYGTASGTNTGIASLWAGGGLTGATTSFLGGLKITYRTIKRGTTAVTMYDTDGNSGKIHRFQLGSVSSANNTAYVGNDGTTGFTVYSAGGASATGIQGHFEADSEL